jgi:hypothetical protein
MQMDGNYGLKNTRTGTGPGPADYAGLREAAAEIQRMRLSARRELELARKIRADACRYQQETAIRARSEAQQLILKARLTVRREIEGLTCQAAEEIRKVLADIRVIRITAQEELAAQRKFTNSARLASLNPGNGEGHAKPEGKKRRKITAAK